MPTGPSASGAAGVRSLQTSGGEWQKKNMAKGVTSRTQGPFQKATVEQDGWVSAGNVNRSNLAGLQYITQSWRIAGGVDGVINRRGGNQFTDLFLKTPQPRAIPENPICHLTGGQIYKLEHVGDFFQGSTTTASLQLKTSYLPYGSGKFVADIFANELPEYVPGALVNGKWFGGVSHDMLTSSLSMGYYTGLERGGNVFRIELPAISSGPLVPRTRRPSIHRISPNELFGFIPGLASLASPGPRGSQFCYSSDNGLTWFYYYSSATILTDRTGYSALDPYAWASDSDVYQVRDRFMATTMPSGISIAVVGDGAYSTGRNKLRIYTLGITTTLISSDLTIATEAGNYSTVFRHGGHHHGRPFMQFVNDATGKHYLTFVRAALDGVDSFELPQPAHWTGRARAFDKTTIQCPMYFASANEEKAGYYLCFSEDFGVTWEKRYLIKEDDVAPAVIPLLGEQANYTLQAFADAFLPRQFGAPSPTYPGSPWIGDNSITPPWLE